MIPKTCKYDQGKYCTTECTKDKCYFTGREDMFYKKDRERPKMKSHKLKNKRS